MVKLKKYPYAFTHFGIFLTFKKGSDEILTFKNTLRENLNRKKIKKCDIKKEVKSLNTNKIQLNKIHPL